MDISRANATTPGGMLRAWLEPCTEVTQVYETDQGRRTLQDWYMACNVCLQVYNRDRGVVEVLDEPHR